MLHPDDLDIRILRELGGPSSPRWNARVSFAAISRKLGVDEETVRLRVKRAKERGFLPTVRLMLNPRLIGCEAVSFELEVDSEANKPKALSQLKLVDGVTKIIDYRGKGLMVTVYSATGDSLSRRIQLVESICGSSKSAVWTSRFPQPSVRMRTVDWRIVNALSDDAGRDLGEVAKSLGVSLRTVQRRLSALKEGKAVYLSGSANVSALGGLMCCFVISCPDRERKRAVDAAVQSSFSRIGSSDLSPEDYSIFGMPCENLAQADQVTEKLRHIDGVGSASMRIMKEIIVVPDWQKGEVERRIPAG